jgi:hypothetical protein
LACFSCVDPLVPHPDQRRILLLPSSVRDLPAGQGERALCGVGKILLFSLEVCLAAFRSLAQTLAYTSPDLLGDAMGLDVLAKTPMSADMRLLISNISRSMRSGVSLIT